MHYSTKKTAFGLACIATFCLSSVVLAIEETKATFDNRADIIKNAFKHAWSGYSTFAYGHDELEPLTNGTTDSR
jgi:mannosyl-oligosaccharide alpha-1,2-mannosidase